MPKLTITVFLSPNDKYPSNPDPSWPKPSGVRLRLTNKKKKSDVVKLGATNIEGVTSRDKLTAGKTYKVTVTDRDLKNWRAVGQVKVGQDDTEKELVLVPAKGRWLLPLLLCRYDDDGKPVGISDAKCRYRHEGKMAPAGGSLKARGDGYVYATLKPGTVTLSFQKVTTAAAGRMKPQNPSIRSQIRQGRRQVDVTHVQYLADAGTSASSLGRISIEPRVKTVAGTVSLTGASATLEYSTPSSPRIISPPKKLGPDEKKIWFNDLLPGVYAAKVIPPATFNDWPVMPSGKSFPAERVGPNIRVKHEHTFKCEMVTVKGRIQTMDGRLVEQDVNLEIYGSDKVKVGRARGGTFEIDLDYGVPLKIRLAGNNQINVDDIPLSTEVPEQPLSLNGQNVVVLPYKYGVKGQAVNEAGEPVPGAVIDVFNDQHDGIRSVAAGPDGHFIVGTPESGSYYVAPRTDGGEPVTRKLVPVRSIGDAGEVVIPSGRIERADIRNTAPGGGNEAGGNGTGGNAAGGRDGHGSTREAFTDLAAYPVLTEEVGTSGISRPAAGRPSPAGPDYGQVVDQVMRDVLGWRPSADASGFQAALTGAFQLQQVEGHTEWSWQQRGYAVQADMGALTGAQASIYARAKSALDQVLPLLTSLTPLNPALYPPQDLEAIRTVITAELSELLGELGLAGGPRIQRVDELFGLLLGDKVGSRNLNPDIIHGHLGTLRDRFGLTLDEVDTVDEERIVTNFRIVVEQVLALQASWSTDRSLLTPLDPRASFGTVLIWLSRSLEAVVDSVNDLTFALDSVFVDAAQRQVIELKIPGEPVLLLSDLLDWVVRASRDEGPRIIQDAGKDGVFAFAPVLRRLHGLVKDTRHAARNGHGLPDGMRTPRVDRALQVVVAQLSEAANLAGNVRRDSSPTVFSAQSSRDGQGQLVVDLTGTNFRRAATAFVFAQNREEIPDMRSRSVKVTSPTVAVATFRMPDPRGLTWMLVFTNEDGTSSPPVAITIPAAA